MHVASCNLPSFLEDFSAFVSSQDAANNNVKSYCLLVVASFDLATALWLFRWDVSLLET